MAVTPPAPNGAEKTTPVAIYDNKYVRLAEIRAHPDRDPGDGLYERWKTEWLQTGWVRLYSLLLFPGSLHS